MLFQQIVDAQFMQNLRRKVEYRPCVFAPLCYNMVKDGRCILCSWRLAGTTLLNSCSLNMDDTIIETYVHRQIQKIMSDLRCQESCYYDDIY